MSYEGLDGGQLTMDAVRLVMSVCQVMMTTMTMSILTIVAMIMMMTMTMMMKTMTMMMMMVTMTMMMTTTTTMMMTMTMMMVMINLNLLKSPPHHEIDDHRTNKKQKLIRGRDSFERSNQLPPPTSSSTPPPPSSPPPSSSPPSSSPPSSSPSSSSSSSSVQSSLQLLGSNHSPTDEEDKKKIEENPADDDDDDDDHDDDDDDDDGEDDDDKDLLAPLLSCAGDIGEDTNDEGRAGYDDDEIILYPNFFTGGHSNTMPSEITSEEEDRLDEILFAMLTTSRAVVVFIIGIVLVHLLCMTTEVGLKMALFWRYESYHWCLIRHFSFQPLLTPVDACREDPGGFFSRGYSGFFCHEMSAQNVGCHVKKYYIDQCTAKPHHHYHHRHHYHISTDSCYLSLQNECHLRPRDQTIPSFEARVVGCGRGDSARRTPLYCSAMNRESVISYLETKV